VVLLLAVDESLHLYSDAETAELAAFALSYSVVFLGNDVGLKLTSVCLAGAADARTQLVALVSAAGQLIAALPDHFFVVLAAKVFSWS